MTNTQSKLPAHFDTLSKDHPLRENPSRPWPYKVLIGYRSLGNRKIISTRAIYVLAQEEDGARTAAFGIAKDMAPLKKDGKPLKLSRIVSSRPLDKHDCYRSM